MRVCACALLASFSLAQQPARDTPVRLSPERGTSIIRGRVVGGDDGAPIASAIVSLRTDPLIPARASELTDRQGRYVFTGLPAGAYYISADPPNYRARYFQTHYGATDPFGLPRPLVIGDNVIVEKIDIALRVSGVVSGRVLDQDGAPLANISVSAMRISGTSSLATAYARTTDDLGQFRLYGLIQGDYLIRAEPPQFTDTRFSPTDSLPAPALAPVFYPGVSSEAQAKRVRVRGGQEISGIDIRVAPAPTFRISGSVRDSEGRPLTRGASFVERAYGATSSTDLIVDQDGRFTVRNVFPGEYSILVRPHDEVNDPSAPREFADVPVTVTDTDVEDVLVASHPGVSVPGRVVFEQGVPADATRVEISVLPSPMSMWPQPAARVQRDSSFILRDMFGAQLVRPTSMPDGWSLKAVLLDQNDITDTPTDFERGNALQIVLTSSPAVVTGVVKDDQGRPAAGVSVILFAPDPAAWIQGSSRTLTALSARDGSFRISGVRGGRYLIAAPLPTSGAVLFDDPRRALEALANVATEIYVGDGEQRSIELRIVAPEKDKP